MNYFQGEQMKAVERCVRAQDRATSNLYQCNTLDAVSDYFIALADNRRTESDLYEHFGKEPEIPIEFSIRHSLPF